MLSALRLPGVRLIVGLTAAEYLLEYATSVLVMVIVYERTGSPLAVAAMLLCKQIVPGIAVARWGAAIDGLFASRRLALVYAIRVAGFAFFATQPGLAAILPVAALLGLSGAAARSYLRAALVRTAAGEPLRKALALNNIVFGGVGLLGPALGAFGAATVGVGPSLAVASLAVLVSAAGALAVRRHARLQVAVVDAPQAPAAVRHGAPVSVVSVLTVGGIATALFAMDEPALLAYAEHSLGSGVNAYGAILTAWGVGMVLGSAVYGRLTGGSMVRLFAAATMMTALGYLGLGLAHSLVVALLASMLGGAGNGYFWAALSTLVFETSRAGEEARRAGQLEALGTACPAIGFVLGGIVAELSTPRVTLLVPGIVVLALTAAWLAATRRASARHARAQHDAVLQAARVLA